MPTSAYLQRGGYSAPHASAYLHAVGHFAHWLTDEHLTLQQLNESVVHRFVTDASADVPMPRPVSTDGRSPFRPHWDICWTYCVQTVGFPARRVGLSPAIHDELERFTGYLDDVCGLAAKTRAGRRWWVAQFLADRFGHGPIAIDRLIPRDIVTSWGDRGASYTPGSPPASARSALRSYLRFRAAQYGDRVEALIAAIPTVACWRLAALPSALTSDETARFLHAFDQRTASGRRGYAMARCMVDLGLRVE